MAPPDRHRVEHRRPGQPPIRLDAAKKYRPAAILFNRHLRRLRAEGAEGSLVLIDGLTSGRWPMFAVPLTDPAPPS